MSRLLVFPALAFFAGLVLLLAPIAALSRRPLADRVRPYVPGARATSPRLGVLSVASFRDAISPITATAGARLARLFGVHEELALRLERVHSPIDAGAYRLRQMASALVALVACGLASTLADLPIPVGILLSLGAPLLVFLTLEQRVAKQSERWQEQVFRELPVVTEQIGLLLGAGYSLGSALQRVARRGSGACAKDLQRVVGRIRQGLSEVDALREWASIVEVPAVHRLVGVLALNREGGDLGRLIAEEARSIRRDAHRTLIESIERRAQKVWIPVTVATLVPGVIFMAIPFVQALSLFSGS